MEKQFRAGHGVSGRELTRKKFVMLNKLPELIKNRGVHK
jgi:hypothetical protein